MSERACEFPVYVTISCIYYVRNAATDVLVIQISVSENNNQICYPHIVDVIVFVVEKTRMKICQNQ